MGPVHFLSQTEFDQLWDGAVELARMEKAEMDKDGGGSGGGEKISAEEFMRLKQGG